MDKNQLQIEVEKALAENPSLFLVSIDVQADNKILVVIDGDSGVQLNECIRVNRAVEEKFDREEEDFSLEVSSPDITKPLLLLRQYKKNIGRLLEVKTQDEKFEGTLVEVSEEEIELKWKTREPKPIGKGKVTVEKTAKIEYNKIVEAKVKLIF